MKFRWWAWSLSPMSRGSCGCRSNGGGLCSDVNLFKQKEPDQQVGPKDQWWVPEGRESSPKCYSSVKTVSNDPWWNNLCALFHVVRHDLNLKKWDGIWGINAFYWLRLRCWWRIPGAVLCDYVTCDRMVGGLWVSFTPAGLKFWDFQGLNMLHLASFMTVPLLSQYLCPTALNSLCIYSI